MSTPTIPVGIDEEASSSGANLDAQGQFAMSVPSTTSASAISMRVQIPSANNGNNFSTSSLCLTVPNAAHVATANTKNVTCSYAAPASQSYGPPAVKSSHSVSLPLFATGNPSQVHSLFYEAPCVRVSQGIGEHQASLDTSEYSPLFSNNSQVAQHLRSNDEQSSQGQPKQASSLFKSSSLTFHSNTNPPQALPQQFDSAYRVSNSSRSSSPYAFLSSWSSNRPLNVATSQNMLQSVPVAKVTENSALLRSIPCYSTAQGFQDDKLQGQNQREMLPSVNQPCLQRSNVLSESGLNRYSVSNISNESLVAQMGGNSSTSSSNPIISNQNLPELSSIGVERSENSEVSLSTLASYVGSNPSINYASSSVSVCSDVQPAEFINRSSCESGATSSSVLFSVAGQSNSAFGLTFGCRNSPLQASVPTLGVGLSGNPVPRKSNELQSVAGSSALEILNSSGILSAQGTSNISTRSTVSRAPSAVRLPSMSRVSSVASSSQRPGSFNCPIASTSRDIFGMDVHAYGSNDIESSEAYPVILAEPPARSIASGDLAQRSKSPGEECLVSSSTERGGGEEADGRAGTLDSHAAPLPLLDSTVDSTGDPTPLDCLDNSDREFSHSPTPINSPYSYEADNGLIQSSQYEPSSGIAMNSLKNIYLTSFPAKSHDFYSSSDEEDGTLANFSASHSFIPSLSGGKTSTRTSIPYLFGQRKGSLQGTNPGKSMADQVEEVESPGVACSEDSIGEMASSYELGLSGSLPHSGRDPLARGGPLLQLPDQILEHQQHLTITTRDVSGGLDGDCQSSSTADDQEPPVSEPCAGPSGYKPKGLLKLPEGRQEVPAESTSVTCAPASASDKSNQVPLAGDTSSINFHIPAVVDQEALSASHGKDALQQNFSSPYASSCISVSLPGSGENLSSLTQKICPLEGVDSVGSVLHGENPSSLSQKIYPALERVDGLGSMVHNGMMIAGASPKKSSLPPTPVTGKLPTKFVDVKNEEVFCADNLLDLSQLDEHFSSPVKFLGPAHNRSIAYSNSSNTSGVSAAFDEIFSEDIGDSSSSFREKDSLNHLELSSRSVLESLTQTSYQNFSNSEPGKSVAGTQLTDSLHSSVTLSNNSCVSRQHYVTLSGDDLILGSPCPTLQTQAGQCQTIPVSVSEVKSCTSQVMVSQFTVDHHVRDPNLGEAVVQESPVSVKVEECTTTPPPAASHEVMFQSSSYLESHEGDNMNFVSETVPINSGNLSLDFAGVNVQALQAVQTDAVTFSCSAPPVSSEFSLQNSVSSAKKTSEESMQKNNSLFSTSRDPISPIGCPVSHPIDHGPGSSSPLIVIAADAETTSLAGASPAATDALQDPHNTSVTQQSQHKCAPHAQHSSAALSVGCGVPDSHEKGEADAKYLSQNKDGRDSSTSGTAAGDCDVKMETKDQKHVLFHAKDGLEEVSSLVDSHSQLNQKYCAEKISGTLQAGLPSVGTGENKTPVSGSPTTNSGTSVVADDVMHSRQSAKRVLFKNDVKTTAVPAARRARRSRSRLSRGTWCQGCVQDSSGSCEHHNTDPQGTAPELHSISDRAVRSYAWESLPSNHLSIRKLDSTCSSLQYRYGVFSKGRLTRNTIFGPLRGVLLEQPPKSFPTEQGAQHLHSTAAKSTSAQEGGVAGGQHFSEVEPLLWPFTDAEGKLRYLDTREAEQSNWMRFVAPATDARHVTCRVVERGEGELYFLATCDVLAGTELRVAYSEQYAQRYSLPLLQLSQQQLKEDEEEKSWPCYECDARLPSSELLQEHLVTHDDLLEKGRKRWKSKRGRRSKKTCRPDQPSSHPEEAVSHLPSASAHSDKASSHPDKALSHPTLTSSHSDQTTSHFVAATSHPEKATTHRDQLSVVKTMASSLGCDRRFSAVGSETAPSSEGVPEVQLEGQLRCLVCKKTFTNVQVFSMHRLVHGGTQQDEEEQKASTTCPQCGADCVTLQDLLLHLDCHALPLSPKKGGVKRRRPLGSGRDGAQKAFPGRASGAAATAGDDGGGGMKAPPTTTHYDCPICSTKFASLVDHRAHLTTHLDAEGLYHCPKCAKSFDSFRKVRRHIRAYCSEQLSCPECGRTQPSAVKLRLHMLTHSDRRDFKCGLCPSSFKRKDKLREHERRMHCRPKGGPPAGGRLLKTRPRVLVSYLDRPYHCKMCQLGFKRRGMLVNHFLKCHPLVPIESVQELNKPLPNPRRIYKCIYCHKVYQSNPRRNQHIKKVHPGKALVNPNAAVELAKATSVPSDSSVGTASVSGDDNNNSGTRYAARCQWCKREYMTRAKLYQHMRRYHPAGTDELRGTIETTEQRVMLHDGAKLDGQRSVTDAESQQPLLGDPPQQQTKITLPRGSFVHTPTATHMVSTSSFSPSSSDAKSCPVPPWSEVNCSFSTSVATEAATNVKPNSDLLTQAVCAAIAPDMSTASAGSTVALNLGARSIPVQIVDIGSRSIPVQIADTETRSISVQVADIGTRSIPVQVADIGTRSAPVQVSDIGTRSFPIQIADMTQLARNDYLEQIYISSSEGSSNDVIQTVMVSSADGRECEPVSIVMPKAEEDALMTFELYAPDTGETYRLHLPPGHVLHLAPAAAAAAGVNTSSSNVASAQNL